MKIFRIDADKPDALAIRAAARVIKSGGVVILPTETIYGVAADATNAIAAARVFSAKERPSEKALIVLVDGIHGASRCAQRIPRNAMKLMKAFWPGPLTIILNKKGYIPNAVAPGATVALRSSPHPVVRALIQASRRPLTAPSANISGKAPARSLRELINYFGKKSEVEILLYAGAQRSKTPSTIIDCTEKNPRIVRKGKISEQAIRRALSEN
jgi:L-threonylcarbamoyladenylate synthase